MTRAIAKAVALCVAVALPCLPALAGKADVIDAKARASGAGTWTIEVTVRSDDKGWHKYADKWEVLAPDGRVLATRVLLHPHEDEQPFTRDIDGVTIPPGVTSIRVRAHDKVEGWGGREMTIPLAR